MTAITTLHSLLIATFLSSCWANPSYDADDQIKRYSDLRFDLGKRSDDTEKQFQVLRDDLGKRDGMKISDMSDLDTRLDDLGVILEKDDDEKESDIVKQSRIDDDELDPDDVNKRSSFGKRLRYLRFDLGKRSESEAEKRYSFLRSDLGKRAFLRSDLGKRAFLRSDLGKRAFLRSDLGKRAFLRSDLGKRAFLRSDLGKRPFLRSDLGKRTFLRSDLGKRLYNLRYDLGKRNDAYLDTDIVPESTERKPDLSILAANLLSNLVDDRVDFQKEWEPKLSHPELEKRYQMLRGDLGKRSAEME